MDKILFCLVLCFSQSLQHQAYPPGVPPPNNQHMHQAQPPSNQQYQPQQGQNQQYQGQQNQQYQGQQNQQYQGQPNQQYQGHSNQQYQGQGQNQPNQQQQNLQYQQGGQQQQYQGGQQQQQNTQQFQQQQHAHGSFNQRENVHNSEHIKEHLKEVVDKPEKEMTDDELEFHYFKLHDYDGNNKLDGVEVAKAITHFHEDSHENNSTKEGQNQGEHATPPKVYTDEELVNIIDMVMKEDDLNDDGYIEYFEFVTAQRKAKDDSNQVPNKN